MKNRLNKKNLKWKFDPFGLNSLRNAPEKDRPERKGILRYFQVFWENLGALLLSNAVCFLGFLPVALGISLGLVYGNFWLTLMGGALGGAIAAPFWTAMVDLTLRCYQGRTSGWFPTFRRTLVRVLPPAAGQGAVLGVVVAGLLSIGSFCSELMDAGTLPAFPVTLVLMFDYFLAALAASLLFPPLCFPQNRFGERVRAACAMLFKEPVRMLVAALALLLWCAVGVGLFPISIPFSVVLGFWPIALLTVQLQRPALLEQFGGQSPESDREEARDNHGYTIGQRGEIWWRRHWFIVAAVVICISFGLGIVQTFSGMQEPDLQVAFVHRDTLPDAVSSALQASLEEVVGDRNGDGAALVQINDYQVVFDGSAENADIQTAGSTLLVTDLAGSESSLFVVEDAEGFLALYGDLVDTSAALSWSEYPVLAALDSGTYSLVEDMDKELSGQSLLADYTVFPLLEGDAEAFGNLLERD